MSASKPALRAQMRAVRDAFVAAAVMPIAPAPAFLERLRPGIIVASYWALGGEADPMLLDGAVRAAGGRLAWPHVTSKADPISFLAWDGPLEAGPFGLRQPPADAPAVTAEIIITPLLAFDRAKHRLGQGAGHYDRAFAAHPQAWRVGLAWSVQELPALAPDPWDVPLHAISTEKEWIA